MGAMSILSVTRSSAADKTAGRQGFTLIELLVVMAVIAILAAILLPTLSRARERAQGILCLNNTKQLTLAWHMYADDFEGRLPYNLGMVGSSFRTPLNWVNNVMTWGASAPLDTDNTNTTTITGASLGPYSSAAAIYRCPSDHVVSREQSGAGWDGRIRSYSMNAMVGDAGDFSTNGFNINNPDYVQFFKITQIPRPADIFVFLDEHPDTIDDGYFLNKASEYAEPSVYGSPAYSAAEWTDLPATYHNQATAFSFADGHSALHRWLVPSTIYPVQPDVPYLPVEIATDQRADFNWILAHMSVDQN
jgi:prepilin-type N-terminal cleavage/methylation domain-containing protein